MIDIWPPWSRVRVDGPVAPGCVDVTRLPVLLDEAVTLDEVVPLVLLVGGDMLLDGLEDTVEVVRTEEAVVDKSGPD